MVSPPEITPVISIKQPRNIIPAESLQTFIAYGIQPEQLQDFGRIVGIDDE